MEDKSPRPARRWEALGYGAFVLAAAAAVAFGRGLLRAADAKEVFALLSDGFMVPGVVLAGLGTLAYAASKGIYDSLGYAFSRFSLHSIFPTHNTYKRPESFYDYKQEKDKKGRKWSPAMLIAGVCSLGISGLFLALYLT